MESMSQMKKVTKKEVENIFRRDILPDVQKRYEKNGVKDIPARCEAWNEFTDRLCKSGQITQWQYENWVTPKICG